MPDFAGSDIDGPQLTEFDQIDDVLIGDAQLCRAFFQVNNSSPREEQIGNVCFRIVRNCGFLSFGVHS